MDEYPLVEEKPVDGIPAPNEKPLDEELLEVGTVMHADIAIAPRLHKTIAAICATRLMHRSYSRFAVSQTGRESASPPRARRVSEAVPERLQRLAACGTA
ncbi:MAG: hypothetical protein ACREPW_08275 [Candidatus Binataceae bacterium]